MQEIQFANTASIRMSAEPSILMTRSFSKMLLRARQWPLPDVAAAKPAPPWCLSPI